MIRIALLLVLFSCSHLPSGARVKEIPVANEAEAKLVIQNQINFLKSLFQQTKDPYYNVEKWTKACLDANFIGPLDIKDKSISSYSMLYLKNGEPGHCPYAEGTKLEWLVYHYCQGDKVVKEIKLPQADSPDFQQKEFCL